MADQFQAHLEDQQRTFMVALDFAGLDLKIAADSDIEIRMRAPCCAKEPETCAWLKDNVKSGDTFYDIGANVGAYSLIAARLGAVVYAVEPLAANYRQLCRNALLNGVRTIRPLPVALSDRWTLLALQAEAAGSGANAHLDGSAFSAQAVLALPLDGLVEAFGLKPPTLLKVDVEGAEVAVMDGAARCLAGVRSAIIECQRRTQVEVVERCRAAGLTLSDVHPRIAPGVSNLVFNRTK